MPFDTTFAARTDSGTANNPALNLTGAAAFEITFVASAGGDLILDGGGVPDPNTQVDIGGVLYDFTFEIEGTMPTKNSDGAGQLPEQMKGEVVYLITVHDYPAAGEDTRLAFLPELDPTLAEMDSIGKGRISIQNMNVTPTGGTVCFLTGTKIQTADGPMAVEDLKSGDMIITADRGPMPIIWINSSDHSWPEDDDAAKPIMVSQGALGGDLPTRDLIVSPQHRIMLSGPDVLAAFGVQEVLAPSKGLTDLPGIREMKGKREATYFHVMLPQHAVIYAEDQPTESFYPGGMALQMMDHGHRIQVNKLFPGVGRDPERIYGPKVRTCLSVREAREFVRGDRSSTPSSSGTYATG